MKAEVPKNNPTEASSGDGQGMIAWADAVEKLPGIKPEVKTQLHEPRAVGSHLIELLDLPRQIYIKVSLEDFLTAPDKYLDQIQWSRFYVRAEKIGNNPKMVRKVNATKEEVLAFVNDIASTDKSVDWKLVICEYRENIYGGNVIINTDGEITMEFRGGSQGPISAGTETPKYHANREGLGKSFYYSFEDPDLRRMAWSVMKNIPHDGDEFLPGYYEFQIWQREKDGPLEPIFIDYRDNPLYQASGKNPNQMEIPKD